MNLAKKIKNSVIVCTWLGKFDSKVICFDSECGFWSIALLQYMSLSKSSKATHISWRPSKNSLEAALKITESAVNYEVSLTE